MEAVRRVKDGRTYLFLMNHNADAKQVALPDGYRPWEDEAWDGTLTGYAARVFVRE